MEATNFEYSKEELEGYAIDIVRKIAGKYKLNTTNNRSNLINDILEYQNYLQNKLNTNINNLPSDALRLLALNLGYDDLLKFCRANKRFNNTICRDNIFQKQYGLKHLTSHEERLPKDNKGKYKVLEEFSKIANEHDTYLAKKGYEKKIRKLNLHAHDTHENEYIGNMLIYSAENGYLDVFKYLYKEGYYVDSDYYDKALISAIESGHLDIVKYLVEHFLDEEGDIQVIDDERLRQYAQKGNYYKELMAAAESGHLDIVKYFAELFFDDDTQVVDFKTLRQNAENGDYDKALILAAKNGHLEIVKYLVKNGADIHDNNEEALTLASQYGHLEIVKYLIKQGADIHIIDDQPLLIAVEVGHLDIVKYLIENGANIHVHNELPLTMAARKGYLNIVKYLVENGANIHIKDEAALMEAASNGHLDIVKYLVEQGTDIHAFDNRALYLAALMGYLDIVKYLISVGNYVGIKAVRKIINSGSLNKDIEKYLRSII